MSDWERFRHDLRGGITTVGNRLMAATHRAGWELSAVESRSELARVDRDLARLYQELGEVAYEGWRHAGAVSLRGAEMRARLEAIADLRARREAVRRELAPEDGVEPSPLQRGSV
ncbi:MAG: hypothetical protein HY208_07935 [Nitrospirae bacterium]|nr:hypothetical protein [Nitrospirota bacterium]